MSVAVLAMGSRGDVYPYLALGLLEAGHDLDYSYRYAARKATVYLVRQASLLR